MYILSIVRIYVELLFYKLGFSRSMRNDLYNIYSEVYIHLQYGNILILFAVQTILLFVVKIGYYTAFIICIIICIVAIEYYYLLCQICYETTSIDFDNLLCIIHCSCSIYWKYDPLMNKFYVVWYKLNNFQVFVWFFVL